MNTPTKICVNCKREFPATVEYFHKHSNKQGLRGDCKECRNALTRSKYENNDYHKQRTTDYRRKHPERMVQTVKRWRLRNPDYRRPDATTKVRITMRIWRKNNPERARANDLKRKAMKYNAEGQHTEQDIRNKYALQQGKCYWCSKNVHNKYHVDHIHPLSRGGSNWPDNLAITCPFCNESKGDKFAYLEWIPKNPLYPP